MENSLKASDGDDGSRLSEDRNAKKVRFKDVSDGASVDMAVDSDPHLNAAMSWKDKLFEAGFMYKRKILEAIGSMIGKVVKFDFKTNNRIRNRFARMALFINLDKPLISQICVNREMQRVVYEALPTVCFTCGKYGHVRDLCSLSKETSDKVSDKVVADGDPNSKKDEPGKISEPAFRPWMLVECKSRRRSGNTRDSGDMDAGKGRLGSRFNALTVEGEKTGGEKEMLTDLRELNLQANGSLVGPSPKEHLNRSRQQAYQSKEVPSISIGPMSNFENDCDPKSQASKSGDIKAHFNPAFEGPVKVEVQLTDNILDHEKHSAVTFKNFFNSSDQSKGSPFKHMNAGKTDNKGRNSNEKFGITRGGRKNSNALKGCGSRFKTSENSRVSLADSMKEVVKLISSDLLKGDKMEAPVECEPSGVIDSRQ
ncbi:hypothetical protein PVK06_023440 [Gossypium arboreum]|uniref:CCHC-type domain-containing protein n=1 Tax=Gossypium arboreum TaxID=29729 RepID=A0ABR0PBE9_GOSAR|nr:hypothetical protein PVK06_023440 [Gossypium arboreum]